jgi:hypothetical protein
VHSSSRFLLHIFLVISLQPNLLSGVYTAVVNMTWVILCLRLALCKRPNRLYISVSSPEDGNGSSFRNAVFPSYLEFRAMGKIQKTNDSEHTSKTPWPESASKLYRLSDRRSSGKLVQTFADIGCHVVSVTDPYGHIFCFLDQSRYFLF